MWPLMCSVMSSKVFGTQECHEGHQLIFASCGLLNFEDCPDSRKKDSSVHDHYKKRQNRVPKGALSNPEVKKMFVNSFKANYPHMCDGRKIIVIDCTRIHNPDKDPTLVRHRGTNKFILKSAIQ